MEYTSNIQKTLFINCNTIKDFLEIVNEYDFIYEVNDGMYFTFSNSISSILNEKKENCVNDNTNFEEYLKNNPFLQFIKNEHEDKKVDTIIIEYI